MKDKFYPPGDGGDYIREFEAHIEILKKRFKREGTSRSEARLKAAEDHMRLLYVSYRMQHCTSTITKRDI